jgi:hypothetical protein
MQSKLPCRPLVSSFIKRIANYMHWDNRWFLIYPFQCFSHNVIFVIRTLCVSCMICIHVYFLYLSSLTMYFLHFFCFHLQYQIQILKELSPTMILAIPPCVLSSTFLYHLNWFSVFCWLLSLFELRYLLVALTPTSAKMPWNKFLLLMGKLSMSRFLLERDVVLSSLLTGWCYLLIPYLFPSAHV